MNNAETYLRHLESITGREEDIIRKVDSTDPNLPFVAVFSYRDWPRDGYITAFTFGLSAAEHPDWKLGRPELMISVESEEEVWGFAAGVLAEGLRGECPFCYGNTINFHAVVSEGESELDAFLVFSPPFLECEQMAVELDGFTCNISGLYPMFSSEITLYNEVGLEKFWKLPGWDPFDVRRKRIEA